MATRKMLTMRQSRLLRVMTQEFRLPMAIGLKAGLANHHGTVATLLSLVRRGYVVCQASYKRRRYSFALTAAGMELVRSWELSDITNQYSQPDRYIADDVMPRGGAGSTTFTVIRK